MNSTIRKPSYFRLVMGIVLAAVGFSGVGYIPGKPAYFTLICIFLLLAGIVSFTSYLEDLRRFKRSEDRKGGVR